MIVDFIESGTDNEFSRWKKDKSHNAGGDPKKVQV